MLYAGTPARLHAQCPDGSPPPCSRPAAPAAPAANSVGVMLFSNLARDTAYAYLSDGLASEIATSLARVPRLEVRSPSAVRSAQRGVEADARTVGRRLNVRYVVEGEFQRGGDRIRIAARLVSVADGTQRWSDAWTRPAADLLAVQEEIARAVATAIAGQLLPQERSVLSARATHDPEAYDHFLRGNFHLARRTPEAAARAVADFEAAIRLDPSFAQAQARLALAWALFVDWRWEYPGVSRDSQLVLGEHAADGALTADSLSSDAWMAMAYLRSLRFPRTMEGVLLASMRATQLDPRNAEAWHQHAWWLATSGRLDDGMAAEQRALALEPGRAISYWTMGIIGEVRRDSAAALRAYDGAIGADPEFAVAYATRAFLRLRAGDVAGAREDAEAAMRFGPTGEPGYGLAAASAVAAAAGDTAGAARYAERLIASFADRTPGPLVSFMAAEGLAATGRRDAALEVLERTEPRGLVLRTAMQVMGLDALRAEPRFQRLEAEIRPPEAR